MDSRDLVRAGYDAVADTYLATRREDAAEMELLDDFAARLPAGARVLDAGCGAGVPVARRLAARFDLTGVDFSAAQIELARRHVPGARFVQADMTALGPPEFPDASFAGICSFYAVIHVPRDEQPALFATFQRLLAPGGWLLVTLGRSDSAGDVEQDWLGAGAPMYWSHYDRETNLRLIAAAGFEIIWDRLVRESDEFGGGEHLFVLARSRAARPSPAGGR